jgi:predicted outer membrane repeat protein
MFNKKYMMFFLFLIISVLAISHVSAVDVNTTDEIVSDVVDEEIISEPIDEEIISEPIDEEIVGDVANDNLTMDDDNYEYSYDYGTFTDLENLFASYSSVSLTKDYMYDFDIDDHDDLFYGVDIKHNIKINGKGHTIFGSGARILYIWSSAQNVEISNVKFINAYTDELMSELSSLPSWDGGAIYNDANSLTLVNCTFAYNCAHSGGAIYSTENCDELVVAISTFLNNTASFEGGAIASYGGLCVQGDPDGDDCYFINSWSKYGGAISTNYESFIYYSTFAYNYATSRGGAIYNELANVSHVANCYFKSNYAQDMGGAIWNAIAVYSSFTNNYAGSNKGHDMALGAEISCDDDGYSTNYYNTIHSIGFAFNPSSTVYKTGSDGKTFDVVVTSSPDGEVVRGVMVHLVIDGNYEYEVTTNNSGVASFDLPKLSTGFHDFAVNLVYIPFNDTTKTYSVQIGQLDSKLTLSDSAMAFDYGKSASISATVDGCTLSTNNITVINHPEAKITLSNNVITVSGLDAGSYTLQVTGVPVSTLYTSVTQTVPITVRKVDSTLTFNGNAMTFDYGQVGYTTVTVSGGTLGAVSILGQYGNFVTVNNNMVTVSGLNAGTYTLSASTTPDENHNAVTNSLQINVKKIASSISFNSNTITFDFGKSGNTVMTVSGGTVGPVSIVGHPEASVSVNGNMVTIANLNAGTYINCFYKFRYKS